MRAARQFEVPAFNVQRFGISEIRDIRGQSSHPVAGTLFCNSSGK
jgi:hypothetical protein